MNNGKKQGRGPNLGPRALTLRVLAMSLARSGSTFEKARSSMKLIDGLSRSSQGVRFTTARPCSRSAGTETWSCTTSHTPSIRRKHAVQRTHSSVI
jgi:hypothetical protein